MCKKPYQFAGGEVGLERASNPIKVSGYYLSVIFPDNNIILVFSSNCPKCLKELAIFQPEKSTSIDHYED